MRAGVQQMDPQHGTTSKEKVCATYHVFPSVLFPFASARRKNCAALNCSQRAVSDQYAPVPLQPTHVRFRRGHAQAGKRAAAQTVRRR